MFLRPRTRAQIRRLLAEHAATRHERRALHHEVDAGRHEVAALWARHQALLERKQAVVEDLNSAPPVWPKVARAVFGATVIAVANIAYGLTVSHLGGGDAGQVAMLGVLFGDMLISMVSLLWVLHSVAEAVIRVRLRHDLYLDAVIAEGNVGLAALDANDAAARLAQVEKRLNGLTEGPADV